MGAEITAPGLATPAKNVQMDSIGIVAAAHLPVESVFHARME